MKQKIIIMIFASYYISLILVVMAHGQADLNDIPETTLSAPVVYESIPDIVRIGQNIYSQGFEDALLCMSVIFLRHEYGNPDITGVRPSVEEMQGRCRVRYNLNE